MTRRRLETSFTLGTVAIGLLLAAILGLLGYISLTATPIHPDPQAVRSIADAAPTPTWASVVEEGRQLVRAHMAERNLPGVSVAVAVGGDIVWAEGFGWADLEKRVPVSPQTMFRIGTASTALTAAAAGLLLQQRRLYIDELIQAYVPEYPEKRWPVTMRQLMADVAGIPNDGGDEGPLLSKHCERPVDAVEAFARNSLLFEPGTRHRYTSYGWILVSAAIEAAAHEPFLAFLRNQVFEPLKMDRTIPDSATQAIADRATPYFPRFAADPRYGLDLMRDVDYSCYAGSSIFLSTPSDLVRFAIAIRRGRPLQPATVQLLQTSERLSSGAETGDGLGWDIKTVAFGAQRVRMVGRNGDSLGGMVASLMTFPDHEIVVSVMSNTSYADTFALGLKIAQLFVPARQS